MKTIRNIFRTVIALATPFLLLNCHRGDDGASPGSYLSAAPPARNPLDNWILENYVKPYNIDVVYKWAESLSDQSRFLYPPILDSVQPALNVVTKLWIEPYSSMDPYLVKRVAPRQLVLVGGRNVNPSGTVTLGLAEGGKRISLFEIDLLAKNNRGNIIRFIHTIQHEYVHILNQTKPFDEKNYSQITPSGYTGQWYNEGDAGSRKEGFITAYARSNEREDFAEMASTMLDMSRNEWNKLLNDLGDPGAALIKRKEQLVVDYYKSQYNLDFYKLQEQVNQALVKLLQK